MNQKLLADVRRSITEYCDKEFDFSFNPQKPVVRLHEPSWGAEEIFAATETMLSTYVTMGKKVKAFEQQYCDAYASRYSLMSNSGSSANLLAVAALSNPQTQNHLCCGDEVIVPALSWSTTVWPLIQYGLIPVFVDCDINTFNMDPDKVEKAISPETKAIMLIHTYGNPCEMDQIMDIARRHDLQVIEDCCEALGAQYNGKFAGNFGRVATFSFYFSHHITTLEGGLCVTDEYDFIETLRVLRSHGWSREGEKHAQYVRQHPDIDPRFIFVNLGYNLRPTELQAAIGTHQLPKLADFNAKRRETAAFYQKALEKYADILSVQQETEKGHHVWFGFSVVLKENAPFSLAEITSCLQEHGIETRPVIAGNLTRHPVMQHYRHRVGSTLENSDYIMKNAFAFACHHAVDEAARQYVVETIDAFMAEKNISTA